MGPHSLRSAGPEALRAALVSLAPRFSRRFFEGRQDSTGERRMYLNLVQIAESFGVPERVVLDWVRNEGLPHVADRGFTLFDRAQVVRWATSRGLTAQAGFLASAKGRFRTEFTLEAMLRQGGIWRDVEAAAVVDVFERVVLGMSKVPEPVRALLVRWLREPAGLSWAPAGSGFALPHFTSQVTAGRESGVVALVLSTGGVPLREPAPDGEPVTRSLFFVPPSPRAHLDVLGRLSKILGQESLRAVIASGAPDEAILAAVAAADAPLSRENERSARP
jgi:PTS system nitrogen regulatory IIA component